MGFAEGFKTLNCNGARYYVIGLDLLTFDTSGVNSTLSIISYRPSGC